MSEIKKFKELIQKKHNFIIPKRDGFYRIKESDALKMLESDWFPKKYFLNKCRINRTDHYKLDDIMNFIKNSVNDSDLGDFYKIQESVGKSQRILWRNSHYVIDYHKPMGWFDQENKKSYSDQVLIIVEIIEKVLDNLGIRGINEFDLYRCTDFKFRVDYFINLPIPLIIEVNEKKHSKSLTTALNDLQKDKLNKLRFNVIHIDATTWNKHKEMYLLLIKQHVEKYNAIKFIEETIKKSDELNDIAKELGNDIVNSCSEQEEFPFPLSKCLQKFGITKKNIKYNEIISLFIDTEEIIDDNMSDISSDEELNDLSDSESDHDSESESDYDNKNTKKNLPIKNVLYNPNIDYIFKNEEYYINYPTLVKVGVYCNSIEANNFIDKSWKLIQFISKHGRSAYQNLLGDMTLSFEERKKMFRQYGLMTSQEKDKELTEYKRKIIYFESILKDKLNENTSEQENDNKKTKCSFY